MTGPSRFDSKENYSEQFALKTDAFLMAKQKK
jgi:hypothetical protein